MTAYRSYEDYDTSAQHYDNTRAAVGIEIVLGVLAASGPPLSEQRVLDVGCGTGNYLDALRGLVGSLVGLEYSEGMLRQAREKAHAPLVRGSAFALPFADETFAAIMFNQVVHHFDDGGARSDSFPLLETALRETFRVLEPGGAVLLNHCTHRQIRDAYWWMALIPGGMQRMIERYIPVSALDHLLAEIGFVAIGHAAPLDGILQSRDYLNPSGPLDEEWRRGDSTWALAADDELAAGQARLRAMIDNGTVDQWLEEREALRREVGQTVYIWARKPTR